MKHLIGFSLLWVLTFAGCEKKLEPVPVGEMNEYRDPGYGFKIQYPKEWKQFGTTGKAVFVRSQEVSNKFMDPSTGEEGAQVTVEVMRYNGKSPNDLIQSTKDELKQVGQVSPDEPVAAGGRQAVQVPYLIKATTKTNIYGHQVFVPGDTALYKLDFEGYGEQYAAHHAVFDAMLKSFEIPIVVAKKPDVWQPSSNLETYDSSPFFSMKYPDNLELVQVLKGNKDFVMEMRADRRDCSIHIDVFGAKGLTVDKVWNQNKGNYKAKATGQSTIEGLKAYWVDYTPPKVKDINSRAYFVVKNDKVIRTTLNWYAPQKDIYFPVFEKIVNSLKLK